MATRAGAAPDWRAAFRRSFRRATHMAGAGLLFALLLFLTLSLASYTQTDPSPSTAADGTDIGNWMGLTGAWAAERALNFFGITAALLLPLYDPIKLAEDLAVLDIASGGRVRLVLGMGYRPDEYAMFGKSWEKRGALMDECLSALLQAWSGEPFDYQGRAVRMTPRPFTSPPTSPHPP